MEATSLPSCRIISCEKLGYNRCTVEMCPHFHSIWFRNTPPSQFEHVLLYPHLALDDLASNILALVDKEVHHHIKVYDKAKAMMELQTANKLKSLDSVLGWILEALSNCIAVEMGAQPHTRMQTNKSTEMVFSGSLCKLTG